MRTLSPKRNLPRKFCAVAFALVISESRYGVIFLDVELASCDAVVTCLMGAVLWVVVSR